MLRRLWLSFVFLALYSHKGQRVTDGAGACEKSDFECSNKQCIPSTWRCDSEDDCGDNSDEQGCSSSRCESTQFRCANKRCINKGWKCDGTDDCGDNSDEATTVAPFCQQRSQTCSSTQFQCAVTKRCIHQSFRCDQQNDCGDNDKSDETNCTLNSCKSSEFRCDNGRCISRTWKCDRQNDCGDQSDEKNCNPDACVNDQFKCNYSGHCILKKYICDGQPDCIDGSDESIGCLTTTTAAVTAASTTVVKSTTPTSRTAKPATTVMTTKAMTVPRSTTPPPCPVNHHRCSDDQQCIHRSWLCDGEADCKNGEDESVALCAKVTCAPSEFTCGSGECLQSIYKCDSKEDCRDGSDERPDVCPTLSPIKCTEDMFQCPGSSTCIQNEQVCDGKSDCPNSSDETSQCNINECNTNNGGCLQNCTDLKLGFKCSCRPGFEIGSDSKTCRDINECLQTGICSQTCVNKKGTYTCMCRDGYILDDDQHRCKANAPMAFLVFSNRFDIRWISTAGFHYKTLVSDVRDVSALDVDIHRNMVYWADSVNQTISRADLSNGNNVEVIAKGELKKAEGLAIDWIGMKMYWTESLYDRIEVADLDGSNRLTLLSSGYDKPRAIAVHPRKRLLFWTDWGKQAKIERASMDGLDRKVIVNSQHVTWPNGLTVDHTTDRIYWVDGHRGTLGSSSIDGTALTTVVGGLDNPFSVAVFEDYVYVTNYLGKKVFKVNKFTGKDLKEFDEDFVAPMGITVFHPLSQENVTNPCGDNNGRCSHLCLLSSAKATGYSCACPTTFKLLADGRTCEAPATTPTPRTTASATVCKASMFTCSGGVWACIPKSQLCDGKMDCPLGDDEMKHMCKNRHGTTQGEESGNGKRLAMVVWLSISLVAIVIIAIILIVIYRRRRHRAAHRMVFMPDQSLIPTSKSSKKELMVKYDARHQNPGKNFDNVNYLGAAMEDDSEELIPRGSSPDDDDFTEDECLEGCLIVDKQPV